ncbi:YkgJ family cysteine cluster protein, partial [Desulfovibrio oxamicus]|nr:YkgJ family cysteine cluster protein [Nitratidesulfovibrio oxamicus]
EERCGYAVLAATGAALQRAADDLRARNPGMADPMPLSEDPASPFHVADAAPAVATFLEAVRFDFAFRSIVRERAGVAMEELDFLLGRTVAATAAMYGVAVRMGADGPEVVVLPA